MTSHESPAGVPIGDDGGACDGCLSRTWLLARLSGHLDRLRSRVPEVLESDDADLIAAVAGRDAAHVEAELATFNAQDARRACLEAGLTVVCRCAGAYPERLRDLPAPPAVLHVTGGAIGELSPAGPTVAIVGARRAGPYGLGVAFDLGRGLAAAGVPVVSGMALGVDSAAHEGALEAEGVPLAVLPASPQHAYPASRRSLHRRLVARGAALSELGPDVPVRRWMFPARNRIIAGLSDMTIVVVARDRSGAMVTARIAEELGRGVGAVPGPVGSPLSAGPHALLRGGARLIADAGDVLEVLFGPEAGRSAGRVGAELEGELRRLLDAVGEGHDLAAAFATVGMDTAQGMAAMAALELVGYVRRGAGGRYTATLR
jgi:DNA processing protein